jgi:hypothetical protein
MKRCGRESPLYGNVSESYRGEDGLHAPHLPAKTSTTRARTRSTTRSVRRCLPAHGKKRIIAVNGRKWRCDRNCRLWLRASTWLKDMRREKPLTVIRISRLLGAEVRHLNS